MRYGEVEDALMKLIGAPESYRAALRARVKYFQRLGFGRESPGKGSRIDYSFEDMCRWAFAFELTQFGVDPTRIALMMSNWLWLVIGPALVPETVGGDLLFVAQPVFLSREALEVEEGTGKTGQGLFGIDPYDDEMIYRASQMKDFSPKRAVVLNLTDLRRRIVNALAGEDLNTVN